jgi:LysM repeat protein
MSAKTAQSLVAYAKAQLGLPYFYGTYGQKPTAELVDQKRRQYPDQWSLQRVEYAKAHHLGAPRCYDCVGLIKGFLWSDSPTAPPKYNAAQDVSAGGMRARCKIKGPISSIPELPGVLVFVGTHHVGVYAGGGKVIEAKGFNYGVVESDLKRGSWDYWGQCPWISYDERLTIDDGRLYDAPKPSTVNRQPSIVLHTVKAGDTLWALASRYLGSGYRWPEIQKLNGGIDPRKLQLGMVLKIPRGGKKS